MASYAAEREGLEFWDVLATAAANVRHAPPGTRWPRGHERRHARGICAVRMISELRGRYEKRPQDFVEAIRGTTCSEVMNRVARHFYFGRWIGFKLADILERVYQHPVSFNEAEVFMFDEPREAANLLHASYAGLKAGRVRLTSFGLRNLVNRCCDYFNERRWRAPPHRDRGIGLQEVETILCKWKSHLHGRYPIYNDIIEIRESLEPWLPYSNLAGRFQEAMPCGPA